MNNFAEFSQFQIDLYRAKINAEKNNDTLALTSLKKNYPELFTEKMNKEMQIFFAARDIIKNHPIFQDILSVWKSERLEIEKKKH